MIKWKYKPEGQCPVQAEGWFLGYYFYFRSRYEEATIEFSLTEAGWEVHINYSPVIFYPGWKEEYDNLFSKVKVLQKELKCEVIALTNHVLQMEKATDKAKEIMKYSNEIKNKSGVMRYPLKHKSRLLTEFKLVYSKYFDINTIRYIF